MVRTMLFSTIRFSGLLLLVLLSTGAEARVPAPRIDWRVIGWGETTHVVVLARRWAHRHCASAERYSIRSLTDGRLLAQVEILCPTTTSPMSFAVKVLKPFQHIEVGPLPVERKATFPLKVSGTSPGMSALWQVVAKKTRWARGPFTRAGHPVTRDVVVLERATSRFWYLAVRQGGKTRHRRKTRRLLWLPPLRKHHRYQLVVRESTKALYVVVKDIGKVKGQSGHSELFFAIRKSWLIDPTAPARQRHLLTRAGYEYRPLYLYRTAAEIGPLPERVIVHAACAAEHHGKPRLGAQWFRRTTRLVSPARKRALLMRMSTGNMGRCLRKTLRLLGKR